MKSSKACLVIVCSTVLLSVNYSCKKDKPAPADPPVTAAQVKEEISLALAGKDSLTVFTNRFKNAALSDDEVAGGITLFAPVNKAFNKVGVTANARLSGSLQSAQGSFAPQVTAVASAGATLPDTSEVRDYLVKGKINAGELVSGTSFTTLSGKQLTVTIKDGKPYLNNILISGKEIASGGDYCLHTLSGFIYQDRLPVITGISDTKTFPGWVLTIEGQNFSAGPENNEVKFNGVKAVVHTATASKLTVTVPQGAASGKITLVTKGKTLSSVQDITIMQVKVSTITDLLSLNCTNIQGIALDADDNLYFTDNGNKRVVGYSKAGKATIYQPVMQSATDLNQDGVINESDKTYVLESPWAIAADAQKNIYVSNNDGYNGIYKINVADQKKSGWWAGNGGTAMHSTGPKDAVTVRTVAMQFDKPGNLLLGNLGWVDKIATSGSLTDIAASTAFKNADATIIKDPNVAGIAFDAAGNTYVSDNANHRIWRLGTDGITSIAGNNNATAKDGTGASAQFGSPSNIAADTRGNIYVCDNDYAHTQFLIRVVNPFGEVTTIAGGSGYTDTDGSGSTARFKGVNAIAADSKGVFYIGTDNGSIRRLSIE